MTPTYDAVIVGQGTAGATLAWMLLWQGWKVLVIDQEETVTCSKIAAGLITPVTGKRIAASWRVTELLPAAKAFYRRVEVETKRRFFHERPSVRLFLTEEERHRWSQKRNLPNIAVHLSAPQPNNLTTGDEIDSSGGGFEMAAAQLEVAHYLEASRLAFVHLGAYQVATLDWNSIRIDAEGVFLPSLGTATQFLISCEGFGATLNPFFRWVPFKAARGEILSLRIPDCQEVRSIHGGSWLAPWSGGEFRAGSTYDWNRLDTSITAAGREEILRRIGSFLKLPVIVVDQRAAVRPIIRESKALLGMHPVHSRLGFFNGLGSKGSLHAPFFAAQFAAFLAGAGEIDAEVDLQKNF